MAEHNNQGILQTIRLTSQNKADINFTTKQNTRSPSQKPPSLRKQKSLEKEQLTRLLAQLVSPLNDEAEIVLLAPRLWTIEQYEKALCLDHYLAPHLCREWQHLHRDDATPPTTSEVLRDIHGVPVAKSLSHLAKTIVKRAVAEGIDRAVISLKAGLNFLPATFGCRRPNLEINANFDMETKKILVENITKRGKLVIEEAFALGSLATALKRHNTAIDKHSLQSLAGIYIAPFFFERSNNPKAIWVAALNKLIEGESKFPSHQTSPTPLWAKEINERTLYSVNKIMKTNGIDYFVAKLAENMRFFR